eukprot:1140193-Pelagomonas_calceolata.AAC.3
MMMKIGRLLVTFQASDHPKTAHISIMEPTYSVVEACIHAETEGCVPRKALQYLKAHFQPREAAQLVHGGVALSARDMAVPLGHGRDIEALFETGYSKQLDA